MAFCTAIRGVAYVGILSLLVGCGGRSKAEGGEKLGTPVRVKVVEKRVDSVTTKYSGTIVAATQVDLSFRVGGYVQQIYQVKEGESQRLVQEGDFIKKGTVLVTVRVADYQQRAAAAEASVAEASAAEKQSQLDYDRTKTLYEQSSVPKAELDAVSVRLEAARARVAAAKANAGAASLAVDDTRLVSPMDGVLLKRSVEVGSLVAPGTVACVVADTSSVKAVFGAPDLLAEKLKIGAHLVVSVETKQAELDATVTRISPSADPKSRSFEVEARLANADGSLKPGMIASLSIPTSSLLATSVMLPLTAVVRSPKDPRGFAAFVVEGGDEHATAKMREVKLGDVYGNNVVAIEGLVAGDRVISQGATIVTDGTLVRVVP